MNKKLIALDLDGTLLDDNKEVSFDTANYLKELDRQGHIIVLASGRPLYALERYYNQIGLTSPVVSFNGAYTCSPSDPNFEPIKYEFDVDTIKDIYLTLGKKHIKNMICENIGFSYLEEYNQGHKDFLWITDKELIIGPMLEIVKKPTLTLIWEAPGEIDRNEVERLMQKFPKYMPRYWGNTNYVEIYSTEHTKASAIAQIASRYHINKEDIIAFGDENNDLDMFLIAGTSIAMLNAREEIKNKASLVSVSDNNHDGVMLTLKELLKNK